MFLNFDFQAEIKSAASAASSKPKSGEGRSRGVQDGGSAGRRRPRGTHLELPSLDLGFLDAALAADLITDQDPPIAIHVYKSQGPGGPKPAFGRLKAPFGEFLHIF